MFKFSDVSYSYKNTNILEDVSFNIDKVGVYGILGGSGSGKSTICKLIAGIIKPTKGTIEFNLQDKNIAYISQDKDIFGDLSIFDNIVLGKLKKTNEVELKVKEILKKVSLNEKGLNQKCHSLSGGEKQRVAIARALFHDFDILIADEPLTGLDAIIKVDILKLINEVCKDKILFMVTHDAKELYNQTKTMIIKEGKLIKFDDIKKLNNSKDTYIKKISMGFTY